MLRTKHTPREVYSEDLEYLIAEMREEEKWAEGPSEGVIKDAFKGFILGATASLICVVGFSVMVAAVKVIWEVAAK